jgi:hypothetical protein
MSGMRLKRCLVSATPRRIARFTFLTITLLLSGCDSPKSRLSDADLSEITQVYAEQIELIKELSTEIPQSLVPLVPQHCKADVPKE